MLASTRRRSAATSDDERLESALSTAEQIGALEDAVLHSQFFGNAQIEASILARSIVGTLVRRRPEDVSIMNKFWHSVVQKHASENADWQAFLQGGKEAMKILK